MNQTLVQFFKRYDFSFLGSMCAIFLVGILNLYSATHSQAHDGLNTLYKSQFLWFAISVTLAVCISFFNPKTFERFSYLAFAGTLFLVFLVLLMGKVGMGAQRWLVIAIKNAAFRVHEVRSCFMYGEILHKGESRKAVRI